MNKHRLVIAAASLVTAVAGVAMAAEFPNGTIVVSDQWCAPNNDGACNKRDPGRVTKAVQCNNHYCDNMVYQCSWAPAIANEQPYLDGPIIIPHETERDWNFGWTSDEFGQFSTVTRCPVGWAMIGMEAIANYSDWIRSFCRHVQRPSGWNGITVVLHASTTPISDEAPNNYAPFTWWISGAACTGLNCDNMFYYYSTVHW